MILSRLVSINGRFLEAQHSDRAEPDAEQDKHSLPSIWAHTCYNTSSKLIEATASTDTEMQAA